MNIYERVRAQIAATERAKVGGLSTDVVSPKAISRRRDFARTAKLGKTILLAKDYDLTTSQIQNALESK